MKKHLRKWLSFLAAAVLLAGSSACAVPDLQEEPNNFFVSSDEQYRDLIDHITSASASDSFNGSVLIATKDGIILYGGPKAKNRDGEPVDLYTTYDIGSCSKLFTAVAVFRLIDAGLLSLDDPLTRFFPEYETGRKITVYHLLHMQSGIPDYVNDPPAFWTDVTEENMAEFYPRSFGDRIPDSEFLENLYSAQLYFEPGTEQSYCNTNYHLLAMIVEQVSGMRFCDYLRDNIFSVCGMEHTTSMVAGNETSVPKLFSDLREAGIVDENGYSMEPNNERGAGGIHTCLADFWEFDKALFSGRLVSRGSLAEIMNFDMEYGCGLYPCGKHAYGHSGRNSTYTTQNVIIESEQFGWVCFIASTSSDTGTHGLDSLLEVALWKLGGN